MSRVGKAPIAIPSGVEVKVAGSTVTVKGAKGESVWEVPALITVKVEDKQVIVDRANETKEARSLHGTIRSVINNMVVGVEKGYVKELEISGVGYKAQIEDLKTLNRPGIVPIVIFGYRHFAVFKGIYGGHVFLADPWRGNISFPVAEFEDKWYKNVVFIVHPDGAPELKALRLTEEDLRYIDEDEARRIIFDPTTDATRPVDRRIDNRPGEYQIYRRP